jgi:hypothetical protein
MRPSAVARIQDVASALCDGVVDERAVRELERRDAGCLGLREGAVDLTRPGQLALAPRAAMLRTSGAMATTIDATSVP